jgi:hypothetical protein
MRVFNFLVVATVFATIFLAIATLSALATSAVHGQLSAKPKSEGSRSEDRCQYPGVAAGFPWSGAS